MEKIKTCPFCGGENISLEEIEPHLPDSRGETLIECWDCSAAITGETKEEAIKRWNRRADNEGEMQA